MGWKSLFVHLHPSLITTRYTICGQDIIILQQRNNTTILHRIVSIKNIFNKTLSCIRTLMLLCFSLNTIFSFFFPPLSTSSLLFSLDRILLFSLLKAHCLSMILTPFGFPFSIEFQLVFVNLF